MRKQPELPPPSVPSFKQPSGIVIQQREYKLLTPLYGGGVNPTEADPVTIVRATEVRGHLRFWWRACKAGKFNGDVAAIKKEEDAIWGKAYKKGDPTPSQKQTIQITVDVDPSRRGEPVKPFFMQNRRPKPTNGIPGYAAFPLQPDEKERKKPQPHIPEVQKSVYFTLTISYPATRSQDVEAALWAWENFGGLGARTRRGFGALCRLEASNDIPHREIPVSNNVERWMRDKLSQYVEPGDFPAGLPHLSKNMDLLVIQSYSEPMQAWNKLIRVLQDFRQAKRNNRTVWPEAKAIREAVQEGKAQTAFKFPRAALGLPIIFHFKDDAPPQTTLKEAVMEEDEEEKERFASPLILRPLLCRNNKAVGLALLLEGSRATLERLELVEQDNEQKHSVRGNLTRSEARSIDVLHGETDVLKAFMNFLKSENTRGR